MTSSETVIKKDVMMKRAQMKSRFKIENYKSRYFQLFSSYLSYSEGSLERGPGKEKGRVYVQDIKVVEFVDDDALNKQNVFQIVHSHKGENVPLYIIAAYMDQRRTWVERLRDVCQAAHATLSDYYHPGVYQQGTRKYSCCESIDRRKAGCKKSFWGELKPPEIPELPNSTEDHMMRKKVVALFDYNPTEVGDLQLIKGEEYKVLSSDKAHWWHAENQYGEQGYIPANYVEELTETGLEKYDWFRRTWSRQEAEMALRREGREGYFVVRESRQKDMYSLSVYTRELGGTTKHYHIKKTANDMYYVSESHPFPTIPELIYYHKHNSAGLVVRLRNSPTNSEQPATVGFGSDMLEIDRNELQLSHELGHGQFGSVHLAKYKGQKNVAVKMMQEGAMSEDDFVAEAEVMKKLHHDYLVQLFGVCYRNGPIFLVTEYMENGALLSYLKKHKESLLRDSQTLTNMCFQVSSGMMYLESQKFIHRDLAARNCLVSANGITKVGDFGLARFVLDDEYTCSSGTKFPIKWAPPEVLQYTRFSSKSDVWAFGVLMWEVYTGGDMPYGRMRNPEVVEKVVRGYRLDQPNACPDNIYAIMHSTWEREAEKRPTFVELERQLETGY